MLRAAGRYGEAYFPTFPHSPSEYAQRLDAVRYARLRAGRDPLAIVPAMQMFVVTGIIRDYVDEALDSKVFGYSDSMRPMSISPATVHSTRWVPAFPG